MIPLRRNRSPAAIPPSFHVAKSIENAGELIDAYYAAKAADKKIAFRSKVWSSAKARFKKDTGGKCAYCEASTDAVAHGDVEHFRPKSKYWWLAYCFDNYLYSCQICNQLYKGDRFPISRVALDGPQMPDVRPSGAALASLQAMLHLDPLLVTDEEVVRLWEAEEADLINPYFEDPSALFGYEADDANQEIWLRAADGPRSARAMKAAEECLGLNRETLRRSRYSAYTVVRLLSDVLNAPTSAGVQADARALIIRQQKSDYPFAGMIRWYAKAWGLPSPPQP